jgi:hypothetical protein
MCTHPKLHRCQANSCSHARNSSCTCLQTRGEKTNKSQSQSYFTLILATLPSRLSAVRSRSFPFIRVPGSQVTGAEHSPKAPAPTPRRKAVLRCFANQLNHRRPLRQSQPRSPVLTPTPHPPSTADAPAPCKSHPAPEAPHACPPQRLPLYPARQCCRSAGLWRGGVPRRRPSGAEHRGCNPRSAGMLLRSRRQEHW